MKKILLIGSKGQLGQYLVKGINTLDVELIEISREQLDLTNTQLIQTCLAEQQPDMIINASAYTAVDQAEQEQDLAYQVNCLAPAEMAKFSFQARIPFLHYSTDYVFSGESPKPYRELDETDPQGVYGSTKLAGEQQLLDSGAMVYIFRTAWVYSQQGKNFYKTMLQLAQNRTELNVVNDQIGSPTYAGSIADASVTIVEKILQGQTYAKGLYHMTCSGKTHWADFAKEIFSLNNCSVEVTGIPSSEYPTPAKRPAYSVLDNQKLVDEFGVKLPSWESALQDCVNEMGKV